MGMRQAKELISGSSDKNTNYLLELSRDNLRTVTGILIGHCQLRRHQFLRGIIEYPTCRCVYGVVSSIHPFADNIPGRVNNDAQGNQRAKT